MTDAVQAPWSEPITLLEDFRDPATRIEGSFQDFPRPEGRLYAVLGGPRMGKTSLLNVLPEWLLREPVRNGQRLVPTFIDYRQDERNLVSPRAFLVQLVKQLREGLRSLGLCTISERNFEPFFEGRPAADGFRDALAFLLEEARRASTPEGISLGGVRLIALVDDAEEIACLPWADDLFRDLRDLYAREQLVRRQLDLVVAGEDRLARHFDRGAPWADGGRAPLYPIVPEVIATWLHEASEGRSLPAFARAIAAESGGQPFLVRYFVHETGRQAERRQGWDRLPPDVTDRLAKRFLAQHSDLLVAWTRSVRPTDVHDPAWLTCCLLAEAGGTGLDVYDVEDQLWDVGLQADAEQTLDRLAWQGIAWPVPDTPHCFAIGGVFSRHLQQVEARAILEPRAYLEAAQAVPTGYRGAEITPAPGRRAAAAVLDYDDLSIRLSAERDGYRIHVTSREGDADGTFRSPLSPDELATVWKHTAQPLDTSGEMEEMGGRLFHAIFRDEVLARFRSAWESARRERLGLRLKLILEPPELHSIPWEFLYDQGQLHFLALSNKTPLVRYVERPTPIPRFERVTQLRLLAVVASPEDQPPLNLAREVGNLQAALGPARAQGWLEYRIAQGQEANAGSLLRLLRQMDYHIFHFSGHGVYDAATGQGLVLMEGPDRRSEPLAARQLAVLLRDETDIRLVFLNACETALTSETTPFASVAGALVQADVPAVVATQYAISDGAAASFTREFYQALAESHPVEAAVAEGRKAMQLSQGNYEWGVPILYLRAQDGRVFR